MSDERLSAGDDASNAFVSAAASLTAPATAVGAEAAVPLAAHVWPVALGALLRAFNHVLGQHAWARERLAPFSGQTVRMVAATPLGDVAASAAILPDGRLQAAASDAPPAVTLAVRAPLDALVAVAGAGTAAAMPHLRIEGDAALAAAIGQIAPHLRWDIEDDLSRVVGDVAARRLADLFGRLRHGLRDLRLRGESATVAYLVHEDPQLVSGPMLESLRDAVRTLRDDLERLDKRIERLERGARP